MSKSQILQSGEPYDVHFMIQRPAADGRDEMFPIDAGFPQAIRGQIDLAMVDEGTAAFLHGLVRMLRPKAVLETGTNRGRSARAIASALKENGQGHLWTVDQHDWSAYHQAAFAGVEAWVTTVVGTTPEALSEKLPPFGFDQRVEGNTVAHPPLDFVHLDGDHTARGVEAELDWVRAHKAAECVVAIDNTRDDGYADLRNFLAEYDRYPRISLASMCGLDLIWMRESTSSARRQGIVARAT